MPQTSSTLDLIPDIEPGQWEKHDGFRATTLLYVTDPEDNATVRRFAALFSRFIADYPAWPPDPEGVTRSMLRAVRADLRYLEGFLAEAGTQCVRVTVEPDEQALCVFAGRLAGEIDKLAERIGEELAR